MRGLQRVVCTLPEAAAERVGAAVGGLVGAPLGIRREVVRANLRLAFPEQSEAWVERLARASYRHLGREAAVMMRLPMLSAEEIRARTHLDGWDEVLAAVERGRGVILATGHLGNWEVAAASVAVRGLPIAAVVRRQGNRLFDAHLDATRRRLGVETIAQREARHAVPRILQAGGVVALVADQDVRERGVFAPFFGRLASTARGPALFALRHGAALFACAALRRPGEEPAYDIAGRPVPVQPTGDLEADVWRVTAELNARLEAVIRLRPEQYFWFHKRWKTPAPPELRRPVAGTNRPAGDAGRRADGAAPLDG